jgi:hypothetical protein
MRLVRFSHLVQSLLGFPFCPEIVTQDVFLAVLLWEGQFFTLSPPMRRCIPPAYFTKIGESPSARLQLREINEAYDAFL